MADKSDGDVLVSPGHAPSSLFVDMGDFVAVSSLPTSDDTPVRNRVTRESGYIPESAAYQRESSTERGVKSPQTHHDTSSVLPESVPSSSYRERPFNIPPFSETSDGAVFRDQTVGDQKRQWTVLGYMQKVCNTQKTVSSHRYSMQRQRQSLKHKRHEVSDLRIGLMDSINTSMPDFSPQSVNAMSLKGMLEQFQQLNEEYQELEDDYRHAEKRLDLEEFRLEEAEKELQNMLENLETHHLTALFGDAAGSQSTSHATSVPDPRTQHHPLVFEYLSHTSQVENLKEDLWELRAEREALLHEQDVRARVGIRLGDDALATLNEARQDEKQILKDLEQSEKDAQRLKIECDNQGLATVLSQPHVYSENIDVEDDSTGPWAVVNPKQSWNESSPSFFDEPKVVDKSVNTTEFINKWLLHKLCQSSLEIFRLSESTGLRSIDPYGDEFRNMVLGSWTTNETLATNPSPGEGSTQSVQVSNVDENVVELSETEEGANIGQAQPPNVDEDSARDQVFSLQTKDDRAEPHSQELTAKSAKVFPVDENSKCCQLGEDSAAAQVQSLELNTVRVRVPSPKDTQVNNATHTKKRAASSPPLAGSTLKSYKRTCRSTNFGQNTSPTRQSGLTERYYETTTVRSAGSHFRTESHDKGNGGNP